MEEKMTDLEIIQRVRRGEQACFTQIVEKYHKPLFKVAFRIVRDSSVAEDVAQEAFMKAYVKLNTFEGRSQFKSWLYQIAINTAKNKLRKASRQAIPMSHIEVAVGAEAELVLVEEDISISIKDEIDLLPARQKTALILRVFEDMSFKEIARIMNCPYDTAKANYRHALLKLRRKFGESMEMKKFINEKSSMIPEVKFVSREVES